MILLYILTVAMSVYGNSLVLVIVSKTKSLKSVNNLLIGNLAITDIFIAIFITPIQVFAALEQRWDMPEFMCKACPFAQSFLINVVVFTTLLIAKYR